MEVSSLTNVAIKHPILLAERSSKLRSPCNKFTFGPMSAVTPLRDYINCTSQYIMIDYIGCTGTGKSGLHRNVWLSKPFADPLGEKQLAHVETLASF